MKLSNNLHAPAALPPGKDYGTHWIGGWTGPKAGLDEVAKTKKDPFLAGNRTLVVQPVA
jgi:hypothetical protein